MKRQYFGTDGIRGIAGEPPLTASFTLQLGQAAAQVLASKKFYLGRDTRCSGPMLSQALSAGLMACGVEVRDLGIVPTPAVAHACWQEGCAGAVISASHNPFADNGIKFFDTQGHKLSDGLESDIEAQLDHPIAQCQGAAIGNSKQGLRVLSQYLEFLAHHTPTLAGMRLGIDCANGAAYALAQQVFARTGAELHFINTTPNGVNINADCGSTHLEAIQTLVKEQSLDLGIAFDGDADRCLLVDTHGRVANGDHILTICALARGDDAIVSTVMGNMGAEVFLNAKGIATKRAKVGDRYVKAMLQDQGIQLGGEQSGHVLFLDKLPTGDGMFTALQSLQALQTLDTPLEEWLETIPTFPQVLINVPVAAARKHDLVEDASVQEAVTQVEDTLAGQGRVNLRPSGTEALVRVMVEGQDESQVRQLAERIAAVVRQADNN